MSKIRVVFLGTPEFAVHSLEALLKDDHYEVVGVVTQPDRPSGRKLQLTPSPVKQKALEKNLKVISPEKITKEIREEIVSWSAEVAVVVAFGQILSEKFLQSFQFGAVNLHASLLPRWRGAAPIQRGVEAGDKEGGV
ncbi:MAG: methionyl-tRNA formyltransferase, partial [Pseudobdellovibrionaceae bacterium]